MDSFNLAARTAALVASALHRCVSACADAEKGYTLAADAADAAADGVLRAFFEQAREERRGFARELQTVLAELGQPPDGVGTVLGVLHRATVDVRLVVSGHSEQVLLEECDRGEREAQHVYEVARSELVRIGAPKAIRDAVDAQYAAVCNARFEIDRRLTAMAPTSAPRSRR